MLIHSDRLADLPYLKIRNKLVNSGHVAPHHVLLQSDGLVIGLIQLKIHVHQLNYLTLNMSSSNQNMPINKRKKKRREDILEGKYSKVA